MLQVCLVGIIPLILSFCIKAFYAKINNISITVNILVKGCIQSFFLKSVIRICKYHPFSRSIFKPHISGMTCSFCLGLIQIKNGQVALFTPTFKRLQLNNVFFIAIVVYNNYLHVISLRYGQNTTFQQGRYILMWNYN